MTPEETAASLRRVQLELADLTQRLARASSYLDQLAAHLGAPAQPTTAAQRPGRPEPVPSLPPTAFPAASGPVPSQPGMRPAASPAAAFQGRAPVPPTGSPATVPPVMTPPRRRVTVAEVFSVVGSAVCLIGVALVLLLPADGVLSPLVRVGIAALLALGTTAVGIWQHARDEDNAGAGALVATGIAAAYLSVLAASVVLTWPDGSALLPQLPGLALAAVIGFAGMALARWWDSQWLAVLAVLGSLVLAPVVLWGEVASCLVFMIVMTTATAVFQRGRVWIALMAARMLPTSFVFSVAAVVAEDSWLAPVSGIFGLAVALALVGLGLAALHQLGTVAAERTAAAFFLVATSVPALVMCWRVDLVMAATGCLVLAAAHTVLALLPRFAGPLTATSLPLGAAFLAFAALRIFDGEHLTSVVLVLAAVYWTMAAMLRLTSAMVTAVALTLVGVVVWTQYLPELFHPTHPERAEAIIASLAGVATVVLAVWAVNRIAGRQGWQSWALWLGSIGFASAAVILSGSALGSAMGDTMAGFQVAHALTTLGWLVLCVVLLALGLRRSQGLTPVRIAILLAIAAVAKLFVFDLAALPGLVRALAFLAVGVLLLGIGTWYSRQLQRVRQQTPQPGDGGQP